VLAALGMLWVGSGVRAGGVTVVAVPEAELAAALDAGDPVRLERALAAGADPNVRLASNERPLIRALRTRANPLVAICLDWCAAWTPAAAGEPEALSLAVTTRNHEAARLLLDAGADPNFPLAAPVPGILAEPFTDPGFRLQLRTDAGLTPLMLAAVLGDEPMVRLLLERGGRPERKTRRYTTSAVTLAAKVGKTRVAQQLLGRDPDAPDNHRVVVCLGEQRVTLFRGNEFLLASRCSTGRKGFPTPTGSYVITSKHRQWVSTIYKVPMPWLLRLNGSDIGLHQGVVPGYPASHGCIRVPRGPAERLFQIARIGDRVDIVP
jgi:lipoprotein-anchoring transpeptidase ErfK/SrfK